MLTSSTMKGPQPMGCWKKGACWTCKGSMPSNSLLGTGANWVKVSRASGAILSKVMVIFWPSMAIPEKVSLKTSLVLLPSMAEKVEMNTALATGVLDTNSMLHLMSSGVTLSPLCQ